MTAHMNRILQTGRTFIATKPVRLFVIYGLASLTCYFLLYRFEDSILVASTRGGWNFIEPVFIAFLFSFVHGGFTARFWDILDIKAKEISSKPLE
jgi:hypothetical protein